MHRRKLTPNEFRIIFTGAAHYDPDGTSTNQFQRAADRIKRELEADIIRILQEEEPLRANSHYEGNFSIREVDVEA